MKGGAIGYGWGLHVSGVVAIEGWVTFEGLSCILGGGGVLQVRSEIRGKDVVKILYRSTVTFMICK